MSEASVDAAVPPAPGSASRSAFHGRWGWTAYLLALAGSAASGVALLSEPNPFTVVEGCLVLIAALSLVVDRVDVHVFVRATLWGALVGGAWLFPGLRDSIIPAVVLFGSAVALLALGGAGFDSKRGPFQPRVLKRSLLTMMVVGLCVAHVFAVTAALTEVIAFDALNRVAFSMPSVTLSRGLMFLTPLLLGAGVIGLSRTRTWGLLALVGGWLTAIATIAISWTWAGDMPEGAEVWVAIMSIAWGFGVFVSFAAALPVLSALAFRRRARQAEGRAWGRYVHAALIATVVALSLYARLG